LAPRINPHLPDGGVFKAEVVAFDSSWQLQLVGQLVGAPASGLAGVWNRRSERPKSDFSCHQDARLPWFLMEHVTVELVTLST
jgi:hypothetical protein